MAERFFGVDGEMSGADIDDGHKLIQIGAAVDTGPDGSRLRVPKVFTSLIGWDDSDLPWSERAAQVHNIPRDRVLAAPRADVVDELLVQWLQEQGADAAARRDQIMVGFNVGAFDSPFIREALPRAFAYFSRRYADLNPVVFLLGHAAPRSGDGGVPTASAWKRKLKNAGRELVAAAGLTAPEHDAGTDAVLALGAWREAETHVGALAVDAGKQRRRDREKRLQAARTPR